jgi:hypothetical protein
MARRSAAQVNALRLIAEGGVKVHEFRHIGRWRIAAPGGRTIGTATYRVLERDGLITRDTSTSFIEGQAVSLTDAGRTEVPKPERPRVEIIIVRDPDCETYLKYYLDGRQVSASEAGVAEYHVDPGASGADEEWVQSMEETARDEASPAAAEELRRQVGHYA